jgi:hypothetical protein
MQGPSRGGIQHQIVLLTKLLETFEFAGVGGGMPPQHRPRRVRLNIQGTYGAHLGNTQGAWEHGNIRGTFREQSGNIRGTFGEHLGNIQRKIGEYLETFGGYSGTTQREHSRNIQGICLGNI